ncbi:hypothetical protein QUF64_15700 [Anaerolineales bacterium HSG6]|nr:hypothetical protein [Anaerolineales bacterium HSG6]MDM8529879.1 hypothetical protein [Anaerolineales bacterium HSG25]
MKKKYGLTLLDTFKIWQNADNLKESFVEFNFCFTRSLTTQERNQAIYHFLSGLGELEGLHLYAIYSVDFTADDKLQLTFKSISLDRNHVLLQVMVKFKEKFPVQPAKVLQKP